jgi:hypothetical protein
MAVSIGQHMRILDGSVRASYAAARRATGTRCSCAHRHMPLKLMHALMQAPRFHACMGVGSSRSGSEMKTQGCCGKPVLPSQLAPGTTAELQKALALA